MKQKRKVPTHICLLLGVRVLRGRTTSKASPGRARQWAPWDAVRDADHPRTPWQEAEQRQGLELSPPTLPTSPNAPVPGGRLETRSREGPPHCPCPFHYPVPGPPAVLAQEPQAQLLTDLLPPCGHSVCHLSPPITHTCPSTFQLHNVTNISHGRCPFLLLLSFIIPQFSGIQKRKREPPCPVLHLKLEVPPQFTGSPLSAVTTPEFLSRGLRGSNLDGGDGGCRGGLP